MTELTREQAIEKIRGLLENMKICMLTTVRPDGSLHSRPMAMQQIEFDGDLWFFTARDTDKAAEVDAKHYVNVSARSDDKQSFVSLSGQAFVVDDKAKAAELWNPIYKAWFPEGLDDPQLALLRVEAQTAEYWDSPGGVTTYLLNLVKNLTTNQRRPLGENREVAF
jgi:general stress protein 26